MMITRKTVFAFLLPLSATWPEGADAFAIVRPNTSSYHKDNLGLSLSKRTLHCNPLYASTIEQDQVSEETKTKNSDPKFEENEVLKKAEQEGVASATEAPPEKKKTTPAKIGGAQHKNGILSPLVFATKKFLGEERLNKIRGKAISLHSQTITSFVETSDSKIGEAILARLFVLVDENRDGKISEEELTKALQKLGFTWLQEKQVSNIMKRADLDKNGEVDAEEFFAEAPKTLKANLIKLAKKNGADLGLLV